MNGSLKSDEQLFTMFCAFLAHDHRGKWYTIDVASLLQGFSKQETNNLLQSPATRGRELKLSLLRHKYLGARSPATRGRELKPAPSLDNPLAGRRPPRAGVN